MAPLLSLIIVKNPVLDPGHLELLIEALNQQSSREFNTFWLDQSADPAPLLAQLRAARFEAQCFHVPGRALAGVSCWELLRPFAWLMAHPAMGRWFSYLHMECLPESDFAARLLTTLPEVEASLGPRFIAMLQQLRCPLQLADLHPRHFLAQLRLSDLRTWDPGLRLPYAEYRRYGFAWFEQPWQEDAFAMPSELARELKLFSCTPELLYFQDLFDIFPHLAKAAYARAIRWVRLPETVIYHLDHPRAFLEFSRPFLDAVRLLPERFGHLGLYEAACSPYGYSESDAERGIVTDTLLWFYTRLRHSERGTATLWAQALAAANA